MVQNRGPVLGTKLLLCSFPQTMKLPEKVICLSCLFYSHLLLQPSAVWRNVEPPSPHNFLLSVIPEWALEASPWSAKSKFSSVLILLIFLQQWTYQVLCLQPPFQSWWHPDLVPELLTWWPWTGPCGCCWRATNPCKPSRTSWLLCCWSSSCGLRLGNGITFPSMGSSENVVLPFIRPHKCAHWAPRILCLQKLSR